MLRQLAGWHGKVELNGKQYDSIESVLSMNLTEKECFRIVLNPESETQVNAQNKQAVTEDKEYAITVRQYMTQKSTPVFDFMAKWNNDVPMPMRTMVGRKVKETKGMVYMELHCDILQEVTHVCMKCGRPLTNRVSQFFGVGPECGGHNYVSPFETKEELDKAVSNYRVQLQNIKWSGWIIKSAIEKQEEL